MTRYITMLALTAGLAAAQPVVLEGDTTLHRKYRVDFAVPDLPAFKVLGTTPGEILRPSTPELVTIVASSLLEGGVLPEDLALEVAPLLMFNANRLTLSEFDNNRVLYSLRLSVGTTSETSDSGTVTRLAGVGARVTLIDNGDLRAHGDYRDAVARALLDRARMKDALQAELLEEKGWRMVDVVQDPGRLDELNGLVEARIEEYASRFEGRSFDERLAELKQEYKARNWNQAKWDVAAAGLLAQNPAGDGITATRASFWTTGALPFGGWGQGLLGLEASWYRDAGADWELSTVGGLRCYGGVNRLKAMFECQCEYRETGNLLANCGAEVSPWSGIWLTLTTGMEWEDFTGSGRTHLVSDLDIRFTLPENVEAF